MFLQDATQTQLIVVYFVEFQLLAAVTMKILPTVFWKEMPCSLIDVY
jgi:hypothetical protein